MIEDTVEDYLTQPYRIELMREDAQTWFARVPQLPGCMSEGSTPEEAVAMVQEAMTLWIELALEDGTVIPVPRPTEEYSGKFVVRMPKSLHRDLAATAQREGVSLNQLVVTELARAVGCRDLTASPSRSELEETMTTSLSA